MPKTETRFVDYQALKRAVTMEQVLQRYGVLDQFARGPDSLSGPCPIHKGTNRTAFRVSVSKNCWNCFSECDCGGNVITFVEMMEKVPTIEAANRLVEWFQLDRAQLNAEHDRERRMFRRRPASSESPPAETQADRAKEAVAGASGEQLVPPLAADPKLPAEPQATAKPETAAPKPPKDGVLEYNRPLRFQLELDPSHPYLKERGLLPETIDAFGVGFCAKGVLAQRIAIPIHNAKGELVAYAGRWPAETPPEGRPKYRLPEGFRKSLEIYRLAEAMKEDPQLVLVVVEGFFDAMRLWQLGIRKVVALMGSSLSAGQERLLAQALKPHSQLVVMFDEDEAGRAGREAVVGRLARYAHVRVVAFADEGFAPKDLSAEQAKLLGVLPS